MREARGVEEEEDDGQGGKEMGVNGGRNGEGGEKVDIRIPAKAVTAAAQVVKGVLEEKVELEPEGKGFWD